MGLATDGNLSLDLKRHPVGAPSSGIFVYITEEQSFLGLWGPQGGPAGVELDSNKRNEGAMAVRDSGGNLVWSAP
jgi:hypothetical protein